MKVSKISVEELFLSTTDINSLKSTILLKSGTNKVQM